MSFFEQALAALTLLPDTRQKVERAIDLRLDLRQSLFPLNELATVWRYLEEAEGLARTLDDSRRLGWVSAYMSGHHLHTGGHVSAMRTLAQTVEAIAERLGDLPLQIAAAFYLAAAAHHSGDYHGAERVCRQLVQSLHGHPPHERFGLATFPAVWSRSQLARSLAERGVFDEGEAHGHEAIRIAEALDHPFSAVVGCLDLASLQTRPRRPGPGRPSPRTRGRSVPRVEHPEPYSDRPGVSRARVRVVGTHRGRPLLPATGLNAYEAAGIGIHHSLSVAQLGEAYLLADRWTMPARAPSVP